jgi:hypothetical protein
MVNLKNSFKKKRIKVVVAIPPLFADVPVQQNQQNQPELKGSVLSWYYPSQKFGQFLSFTNSVWSSQETIGCLGPLHLLEALNFY